MLQVKVFIFNLHKPNGHTDIAITNEVNEWLKGAGYVEILTSDSQQFEIGTGFLIWTIWYEDLNNDDESEKVATSYIED